MLSLKVLVVNSLLIVALDASLQLVKSHKHCVPTIPPSSAIIDWWQHSFGSLIYFSDGLRILHYSHCLFLLGESVEAWVFGYCIKHKNCKLTILKFSPLFWTLVHVLQKFLNPRDGVRVRLYCLLALLNSLVQDVTYAPHPIPLAGSISCCLYVCCSICSNDWLHSVVIFIQHIGTHA